MSQLFFGTVKCNFTQVNGESFPFHKDTFLESDDPKLKELSKSRLLPPKYINSQYMALVLPAIPASDLVLQKKEKDVSAIPEIFQKPLLKSSEGKIEGFKSGVRSAIIPYKDKYYRLKGCGNNYDGFPFRGVLDEKRDDLVEIRGCTFEHTSSRELFYFHKVNEIMQKNDVPISNIPLSWMEYDLPNTPLKDVKRICSVYEAKSEKRLSDHVLNGLEKILPLIYDVDLKTMRQRFDESRYDGERIIPTHMAVACEMMLTEIVSFKMMENIPEKLHPDVKKEFENEWKECCKILSEYKPEEGCVGSLMAYLYWTFGREVGKVQRLLTKNDISWGTYEDKLGVHCNSHSNNLCILPEGDSDRPFLSPLDFDMAFSRHVFDREEKLFDEWLRMEEVAQGIALSGGSLNSGVTPVELIEDVTMDTLRWALRDTMVKAYQSAIKDEKDEHPRNPKLTKYCYALIKMALITTSEVIA